MTVKFACAFAAFCAIVHSNIVFILCIGFISYRMRLVKLIESLRALQFAVIIFSALHAAQTAAHNK